MPATDVTQFILSPLPLETNFNFSLCPISVEHFSPKFLINFFPSCVWNTDKLRVNAGFDNDNLIRLSFVIFYRLSVRSSSLFFSRPIMLCSVDLRQGEFKGKLIIKKFSCPTLAKKILLCSRHLGSRAEAQGMNSVHIKSLNCVGIFICFNVAFSSAAFFFSRSFIRNVSWWNLSDN